MNVYKVTFKQKIFSMPPFDDTEWIAAKSFKKAITKFEKTNHVVIKSVELVAENIIV